MKLEVKYIFLTSSSGANFYIFHFPESMEVRKILTLDIRMQYNSQTREDIFCIFKGFSCGSTSNLSRFIYDLVIYFIFLHVLQP